jgi:hypothetical protein
VSHSRPHSSRNGIEGKECAHCHEWKPLLHYAMNRRTPDGLQYSCRECVTTAQRLRPGPAQRARNDRNNLSRQRAAELVYCRSSIPLE